MPVTQLINDGCNFASPDATADMIYSRIKDRPRGEPGFSIFRVVWTSPGQIRKSLDSLRKRHPDAEWELVNPYTFFSLFRDAHARRP